MTMLATSPLARWREQNQSRIENWQRGFYRFRQSNLSLIGLALIVFIFLVAILGPYFVPYPQDAEGAIRVKERFQGPSAAHWFGTDELGRDIFSLVVIGARVSLSIGVIVLASAKEGVSVVEYNPMQVKQAVTGSGTGDKRAVARMVTPPLPVETELPSLTEASVEFWITFTEPAPPPATDPAVRPAEPAPAPPSVRAQISVSDAARTSTSPSEATSAWEMKADTVLATSLTAPEPPTEAAALIPESARENPTPPLLAMMAELSAA